MAEKYSPPPVWEDPEATGKPIDLLAGIASIVLRWPFIAAMGAVGFLLAFGVSLVLTPLYTSRAVFLPPTQRMSSTDNPFAMFTRTPSTAVYSGLLLSESVLGDVVEHCNLQAIFKAKNEQDARVSLRRITQVSTDSSGFVSLQITNADPRLARTIADNFLKSLARLNDRIAMSEAAQQRRVYEEALKHEKDELENAEVELKKLQESSGVVLPQSQMQAGLTTIERIRGEIRAAQVQLTSLLQAETEHAPEVVRSRSQIQALQSQLHSMETGTAGAAGEALTASKAPSVNLEFVRLDREVKYHQVLFDVMAKQYENARLEESSSAPGVQVVDFPEVPVRKSWPPRGSFALIGALLGAFLAFLFILALDQREAIRQVPTTEASLDGLKLAFRNARLRP